MKKIKKLLLLTFVVATMIVTGAFVSQLINPSASLNAETKKMAPLSNIATQTTIANHTTITEVEITNELTDKNSYAINSTGTVISCPISQSLRSTIYAEKDNSENKKYIEDYCNNYEKINYVFLNFKISQTTQTIPSYIKLSLIINNKDIQSHISIFRGIVTKSEDIVWNNTLPNVSKKSKTSTTGYDISFPRTNLDKNGELEFTILLDIQNDYLDSMYISSLECNISSNISNITVEAQKTKYEFESKNTAKVEENLFLKSKIYISENTAYSFKNFNIINIPENAEAINISIKSPYSQVCFVFDELRKNFLFKDIIFFANDFVGFKNNEANINIPLLNKENSLSFSLGILYNYNKVSNGQDISSSLSVNFSNSKESSQLKYFLEKDVNDNFYFNITGIKNSEINIITIPTYYNNIPVRKINEYSFAYNTSISEINFEQNSQILTIGMCAFKACTNLKEITIPSSVTEIEYGVFYNCKSLVSVNFSFDSNLKKLGVCAFNGCESLETLILPNLVKEIRDYTFKACKSLKTIKYYGTYASFSKIKIGIENEYFKNAQLIIISTSKNHKDYDKYDITNYEERNIYDQSYLMR